MSHRHNKYQVGLGVNLELKLTMCRFSSSFPSLPPLQHRPVSAVTPDRRRSGGWAGALDLSSPPGCALALSEGVTSSLPAGRGSADLRSHCPLQTEFTLIKIRQLQIYSSRSRCLVHISSAERKCLYLCSCGCRQTEGLH